MKHALTRLFRMRRPAPAEASRNGRSRGAELRVSRTLAAPHVGGIVILILVVAASVLWMSARQNELAKASSERMVAGGLASFKVKIETVVKDYSIWDEAYAAVRRDDRDWLYRNIGTGAAEIGALDVILIVDPSTGATFGWREGSPVEGEAGLIPPALVASLLRLLDAPSGSAARSGFARMNGAIWAFAVTRVRPVGWTPASVPENLLPRQIHGLMVSESLLAGIGANLLMDDLALQDRTLPGQAAVALEGLSGTEVGQVAWMPPRPGASILRQVALPLALALLGVAIIATVISRYAVRAARHLERALVAAQAADRSKTEFLSNVSHELRTPMNGIIGVAQLLEMTELDGEQKDLVTVLSSSAATQMALISDLLDLTSLEGGNRPLACEPFEPEVVLRESADLVRPAAGQKGLELDCDIAALRSVAVLGDGRAFRQIITNLLGNAVKFTSAGRVGLAAQVVADAGKADLVVRVEDTGPGIAREHQARIFERFFQVDGSITRQADGTGLGLAISKALAEMMGGRIELESLPGTGSTFTLRVNLPLQEARSEVRSAA